MSTKYLGKYFDIHGGGNDLKFPHHENEIAQNMGACEQTPAKYWLHSNMLLMNGKKMSKSDGNTIAPQELFNGKSDHISKGYAPMVVRFFMLQAHYRSTLDITDQALQAAEKGYHRLMEAVKTLDMLETETTEPRVLDPEIASICEGVYEDMNDDFNTPKALARLFELVNKINALKGGQLDLNSISKTGLERLKKTFSTFVFTVFGLTHLQAGGSEPNGVVDGLMDLIIDIRKHARENKNWDTADKIRDSLKSLSIVLKDGKEGTHWTKT